MKLHTHVILLAATILSFSSFAQNRPIAPVEVELQRLIQHPAMKFGEVGFVAMNLDNGDIIAEENGFRAMVPASIMKLYTTAVAYKNIGPVHRFKTTVAYTGQITDGTLLGDLVIYGQGDPTLQSKYFVEQVNHEEILKNALTEAGIKKIDGRFIVDLTTYAPHNTPDGWAWEDMGNYFGATPTALMWGDNMMKVHLKSGQPGTEATLAEPWPKDSPYDLEMNILAAEGNKDDAWFFSAPRGSMIYGKGSIPAHKSRFTVKISDPNPDYTFAKNLIKSLDLGNPAIVLDRNGLIDSDTTTLIVLKSPPLSDILKVTNYQSVNLYAEALNIALDPNEKGKRVEGGNDAVMDYLKKNKLPSGGMRRLDGSGISPMNRLTAQNTVNLLLHMYHSDGFEGFYETLPVGGQSGTLKYYFKEGKATGNLHAKSGTMKGVRNYAGYVKNERGETIAFALFMNDFDERQKPSVMKQVESLMESVIAD